MNWNIDHSRAICPQLCEQICVQIVTGDFPKNSKLPSVRDIAVAAGVNPNTVQKALEGLEQKGVVFAERGSGWFVTDSIDEAKMIVQDVIFNTTKDFIKKLCVLGMGLDDIKNYVKEWNE